MDRKRIKALHHQCIYNREAAMAASLCGCFQCLAVFAPSQIIDWCDKEDATALCPHCGIDAVLPGVSDHETLSQMQQFWFEE